ncbi:hypothetical protein ACHQM5_016122 [Ranunculus cassubicifolius]
MKGYRKIKLLSTTKSQSIDFSDIYSPPQSPKPITKYDPTPLSPPQKSSQQLQTTNDPAPIKEDEDGVGKRFGMILSRNFSTNSTASQRFKADKQNTNIQSAVKRAFSMRRSTSVSEGYCRIYDHSDPTLCSPIDDDNDANFDMQVKIKKKKKGSRILRVCKSLFGM